MYSPRVGTINVLLRKLGLGFLKSGWITDPSIVMYCIIIALIWQFVGYSGIIFLAGIRSIPESQIAAAKVDGAGTWTIYRRIILPLSVIPFVVAALLQVTIIWNDFIWGLVLTTGKVNLPVTVAMANLKGSFVAKWNLQMAGALWVTLPTLIIFIFSGKYIIRGYSGM